MRSVIMGIMLILGCFWGDSLEAQATIGPSAPKGWPGDLWRACWNTAGWGDFTVAAWTNHSAMQQIKYAGAYQEWYAKWKKLPVEKTVLVGGVPLVLRLIPPGKFWMGSPNGEGDSDEHPRHRVLISQAFYLGKHELTQAQWQAVRGENPSHFKRNERLPVEQVSWTQCEQFCQQTSLRLPTEAQWEYASRAGTTTAYLGEYAPGEYAWYKQNSGSKTHLVGEKKPNGFGLYDMTGNVWEGCADRGGGYSAEERVNPTGAPSDGSPRVFRGGGWRSGPGHCRPANRSYGSPDDRFNDLGFRVFSPIP